MAESVTCSSLENVQVLVRTPTHSWVGDLPAGKSGDGLGPRPFEQLMGALGSCIVVVVRLVAARKKIVLERIWTELEGHWEKADGKEQYYIDVRVRVRGDLSDEDVHRLHLAAKACPIHRFLSKATVIELETERA